MKLEEIIEILDEIRDEQAAEYRTVKSEANKNYSLIKIEALTSARNILIARSKQILAPAQAPPNRTSEPRCTGEDRLGRPCNRHITHSGYCSYNG